MSINKEDKFLNIIGLMSGTSIDGIDVSIINTNGQDYFTCNKNFFFEYDKRVKKVLSKYIHNNSFVDDSDKTKIKLSRFITKLHFKALKHSGFLKMANAIGFHGQTILHNPNKFISIQLGDPKYLSKLTQKKVIFNFRQNDIINGGQGAPLAPIFHKTIIDKYNLDLPCCILNIGGIANLTFWDGSQLIGFDTGPGNALIDRYTQIHLKKNFDDKGIIASKGSIDPKLVTSFLKNKFFKKPFPKSLDKMHFEKEFRELEGRNFNHSNSLANLVNFTIKSIELGINLLPKHPKNILVTGGGAKNLFLINELKKTLKIEFIDINKIDINPDFVESELIAFLTARCLYKLPITFPKTTGVKEPLIGGEIYDL